MEYAISGISTLGGELTGYASGNGDEKNQGASTRIMDDVVRLLNDIK